MDAKACDQSKAIKTFRGGGSRRWPYPALVTSRRANHRTARNSADTSPRHVPLDDHARDIAIRALARLARAWPDLPTDAFDTELANRAESSDAASLRPVDLAFAQAIYHAAARRWLTLAWLLNAEIRQGFDALEPRLRAVLLAGAAQLLLLDRVPPHAAINHGVEWAKTIVRPGAGGLVNAVLRKMATLREQSSIEQRPWADEADALPLAAGGVLKLPSARLPSDPIHRLAIATSCPLTLIEHWARTTNAQLTRVRALHAIVEPPVILNIEHADPAVVSGVQALSQHRVPGHAVVSGSDLNTSLQSLGRNRAWVQDPASANAIRSIADLQPRLIVDLCAGQGTKTRQLAATFPSSSILATDVNPARFSTLHATFAGSEQVKVLAMAALREAALDKADLIVLDVPCSNSGVLPRRPEARYRFSPQTLTDLAGVQRQIIADAIPLMSPSRHAAIFYATCSLEPEENTAQPAWALKWHGFTAVHNRLDEPSGQPGEPATQYQDGGFSVLLKGGRVQ